jgi:hypothetical protein
LLHATLTAEFMRNPFLKQLLFDLTVGETVRQVTNQTKGKLHDRVGSIFIN